MEAFDAEPGRLAGEIERMEVEPAYVSKAHRHNAYLARGHYADQLRHVYDLFPAEQVHVLVAEDLFAEPQGTYDALATFLGLPRPRSSTRGRSRRTATSRSLTTSGCD